MNYSKLKKLSIIVFIFILIFMFASCKDEYNGYSGKYPELYSVAIHSLLGSQGFYVHERYEDPQIKILEEDEYGRILFAYCENSKISTLSLLILQKYDDRYAYFYPAYNFISTDGVGLDEKIFNNNISGKFSNEDKKRLKEKNDWDKKLDEIKCIKVEITHKKSEPEVKITDAEFEVLFKKVAVSKGYKGTDKIFRSAIYSTVDDYGRTLYYAWGIGRDANGEGVSIQSLYMNFNLVLIFNPDGSYNEETCTMELTDFYNYQDELKAFKELNNWDKSMDD